MNATNSEVVRSRTMLRSTVALTNASHLNKIAAHHVVMRVVEAYAPSLQGEKQVTLHF